MVMMSRGRRAALIMGLRAARSRRTVRQVDGLVRLDQLAKVRGELVSPSHALAPTAPHAETARQGLIAVDVAEQGDQLLDRDEGRPESLLQPLLLGRQQRDQRKAVPHPDRKSTRLNSSHLGISYAVF